MMNKRLRAVDFVVKPGEKLRLHKRPTSIETLYDSEQSYRRLLKDHVERLSALQELLYASNHFSILIIFQSLDASGKDSAIKHIMSGVNPEGCQVHSFKRPSAEELEHDFLWRAVKLLPPRRMIGVFNRSYYEEVLIVRVHPELLGQEEGGVAATRESGSGKKLHRVWQERYESIVNLEKHLCRNGTRIIKFFLHISKDEQRKRLLKRLDDPKKNWKLDKVDVEERKFWNQYMSAYEKCLSKTSKILSPWYIVPADDKDNAHLIISQIIIDNLNQLKMDYPKPQRDRVKELRIMRKTLSAGD